MATCIWHRQSWQIGIAIAVISGVLLYQERAVAQIVPDGTLGTESSVVTPNIDIKGLPSDRIDGGAIRGADLFHSFQQFNVGAGRGAYFSNPVGVENILSRVTGGNASNIFGKLGVLGNANLFLLNPNGIVFGPNASLDLKGSFVASTGNSLKLGNEREFSATNPAAPPLLRVSVPLGVQFGQTQPKAIVNTGNLSVATGQNLTLLGGTVVSTGQLSALGGQVAVAAVPSGGVVNLSPSVQLLSIDSPSAVPGVDSSGNLSPSSTALVELLASSDRSLNSGLTVSGNGQVELVGSSLPVVDGDVVARNATAHTATLAANHNLMLVESQLSTTGNLNLLAQDTVQVRDSMANPFLAQAGGNLLVRGNHGIDILALNHLSQTPFVSGGKLSLVSDGNVSVDAHFASGAGFSILNTAGEPGNFYSLYDPIISANGDVTFGTYNGPALKVEATGSIQGGNITINAPDFILATFCANNPCSKDAQLLAKSLALILRAGVPALQEPAFGYPGTAFANVPPPSGFGGTTFNLGGGVLPPGSIQVGNININNSPSRGNGGSMILSAAGTIATGSIDSRMRGKGTKRAGAITLNAIGNITIGGDISSFVSIGSIGNGGNITLISKEGNINTTQGTLRSSTARGQGGQIILNAYGNVTTAGIESLVGAGGQGNAGNITITSTNGNINTTPGTLSSATASGQAGQIILNAYGNVTTAGIGSFVGSGGQGDSGNITITSTNGNIETKANIISATPNGKGGNVTLRASLGTITTINNTIRSESVDGVAGNVTLKAAGDINSGNINASTNSNAGYSEITLESKQGSVFLNGVQLSTKNTGSGYAGNIFINAPINHVEIVDSTLENTGYFGIISIDAGGNVSIKNTKLNASTLSVSPQPDVAPIAGNIDITSSSGRIEITNNSSLTTTTQSRYADPGDILLTANNGQIFIQNNSEISSIIENNSGAAGDKSATIRISSNSVEISGSKVDARTKGVGDAASAGDVFVNATDSVILDGTNPFTDFRQFSKTDKTPTEGLFATATQQGGIAGNIYITTGNLMVKNGAAVAVSSPQGQAGNIEIRADKISLDNGAILATTGKSDILGANIVLLGNETTDTELNDLSSQIENNELGKQPLPGSPLQHLALRNESLIEANATNNARGGNIAIKTEILLAFPPTGQNGSDISANAQQGRGGVVAIDSRPLGVYNIEFRPEPTPLNDITASSETGLAGTVTIGLPDVDPRTGLIQLPEDLADSAKLIRQSCPVGGQQSASRFVVTGRGGLPPNPSSALSSDTLLGDADASTQSSNPSDQTRPTDSASDPPVEAQGVERGPKGEVILTAYPSTFTPYRPQPRVPGCDGK